MRDSIEAVVEDSDVIIVGNHAEEFRRVGEQLRQDQQLIDLVRLFEGRTSSGNYEGICW